MAILKLQKNEIELAIESFLLPFTRLGVDFTFAVNLIDIIERELCDKDEVGQFQFHWPMKHEDEVYEMFENVFDNFCYEAQVIVTPFEDEMNQLNWLIQISTFADKD